VDGAAMPCQDDWMKRLSGPKHDGDRVRQILRMVRTRTKSPPKLWTTLLKNYGRLT
jgi:hypothetical protein